MPTDYTLNEAYPNPFNAQTTISFTLPENAHISLVIYNIRGQVVKVIKDQILGSGNHSLKWDASGLSSGLYLCRLQAQDFSAVEKLVLLK
jgi:hypothetical protein